MRILLIVTIFLTNILFANSTYTEQNFQKIDMHGGKTDNLINQKNSLSNKNSNTIGIIKPIVPTAPETLIKEEKKEDKK